MPICETVNANDNQSPDKIVSSNPPNMVYELISSYVHKYLGCFFERQRNHFSTD